MLSTIGWVDGLTASGVVIIGFVFGVYFIHKSKKVEADLLFYLGLVVILAGLAFLGVFLDFLTVITTGKNISNIYGLVGILSYIWIAPLVVLGMYMGARLIIPEKKRIISVIYFVLMILFEIAIFLDPMNSFNFVYPKRSGEALIDYNLVLMSPAGFLMILFIISLVVFLGLGFLIKAFQAKGIVRRKLLLVSIGVFLYAIFGMFESLTEPGFTLIFIRIGYISGPLFMYLGLKE